MTAIHFSSEAQADFLRLPLAIKQRVQQIITERLVLWPSVSGAKALRQEWKGHYRIRTGAYRIIFRETGAGLLVVRIDKRSDVYEN